MEVGKGLFGMRTSYKWKERMHTLAVDVFPLLCPGTQCGIRKYLRLSPRGLAGPCPLSLRLKEKDQSLPQFLRNRSRAAPPETYACRSLDRTPERVHQTHGMASLRGLHGESSLHWERKPAPNISQCDSRETN